MIRQRTIKDSVTIEGAGLQTGSKTKLVIKGAPADSGINFVRVDLPNKPLLNIKSLSFERFAQKQRQTTIGSGQEGEIRTTEHLLAALSALGISNVIIETDGLELPGLDGSAKDYVDLMDRADIIEQDAPVRNLIIEKPVWCAGKDAFLSVFPYNALRISYFLSYSVPSIGEQFLSVEISEEVFRREIAPARTFCMKKEALLLLALGYGKGASCKNTLVMDRFGPFKNSLRFSDEHVRHKILDLIGDLSLIGMPLQGHVVAVKSGHKLNMELVKKLRAIA